MSPTMFSRLMYAKDSAVSYMVDKITHICSQIPTRRPGSNGERKAAEYMASLLQSDGHCENTSVESFREHPSSFYGYCILSAIFDTLSGIGFFLHPAIGLISGCISLLLFLFFFVLYKPVIDPLFPEREGTNVTAICPPQGNVKRRILLNAHVDASWEFTLNYHLGGIAFEIPNVMATAGVLFNIFVAVCALCGLGNWTHTAACWGLLFIPFFVAVGFTYNPRRVVPGANDNLSGCAMGMGMLSILWSEGASLYHTEIGVILTGSEEAGLRGSKAWCKVHAGEFKDVPTFIITIDTIHSPDQLMINTKDLNGTVSCDPALCKALLTAAKDAGVPCKEAKIPLFGGATDSAAFTQGGFRSASITAMSHKLESYYHTRRDTPDQLNEEGLGNCYALLAKLIEMAEQGDLDHI